MASPNVKVNTFFKQKQKPFVDSISKLYIAAATLLGMNRLPVILNEAKCILTSIVVTYSILLCSCICYISYSFGTYSLIVGWVALIEYTFEITFSFITWSRMERYYKELNKFDAEVSCRPKMTAQSINNLIFMVVYNVFFTFSFWVMYVWRNQGEPFNFHGIPMNLLHALELFYYGHLLSLVIPRLRLINYFMETALSNGEVASCPDIDKFMSFKTNNDNNTDIKKLMDLYYIVIKAYDFLVEAIKWQLMVIITTSFIWILMFCYDFASDLMREERLTVSIMTDFNLMAMKTLTLFSPCIFGDRVHGEVRRLREHLAARLFEKNNLDKSGRTAARALLALTEARDLSFSLLRMLRVDISLPFKFIGLLVTYLIILLQFEKVLRPQQTATT